MDGLTEKYPELFDTDGGSGDRLASNFSKKWRAYGTIVELAGGDILKIDEVTSQPLEKCLLLLAYKGDKNLLGNMMHEASLKGNT